MEQLLEIAGRDMDGSSGDGRAIFGEERDLEDMEDLEDLEDEEEDEEDEEVEVDEEDMDEDDEEEEEEEEEENRPVKRQRGADALSHLQQNTIASRGGGAGGGGGSGAGAGAGGSGAVSALSASAGGGSDDSDDEDNVDQEKEVIEILSDEEDAHSSHGQTPASFGREPLHRSTTRPDFGAHSEGGRSSHQGSRDRPSLSRDRPSWSLRYRDEHDGARDSLDGAKPPLPDFHCGVPSRVSLPSLQQQQQHQHQQKQPHLPMTWPEPSRSRTSGGGGSGGGGGGSFVSPWMARSPSPRDSSGQGAGGEDGKPSAKDKIGAARAESPLHSWASEVAGRAAGGAAEVEVEAETEVEAAKVSSAAAAAAATSVTSNLGNRNAPSDVAAVAAAAASAAAAAAAAAGATIAPTVVVAGTVAAAEAKTTTEFPLNLECAICLSPIAVAALFACGHGSCWECAHDWCSRNTSPSMDCPTCHVSIPRNDFRRCIVLDQVVDRAVAAAGLDDDEWRSRLERGQTLAREAETARRGARDAQRSAEEAVVEQAAEIQRLREDGRSRTPGRWRRPYEGPPPAMTDYGFRVMSDRDLLDPASQRSLEGFTRLRGRRDGGIEAVRSRAGSAASEAAVVATAAVLSMPASGGGGGGGGYGGVRSRAQAQSGSSTASALGVNGEDPWFSLRSSQPGRHAGVAMSGGGGGRIGREVFGRSNTSGGRNTGHSAGGLDQSAGAVLKSAHERDGSNWRSAYFGPGPGPTRMPRTVPGESHHQPSGGRARNATLSSIHTMMTVPSGPLAVEPMRGPAAPGRRPAAQAPPARSSRKRLSMRGLMGGGGEGGAAAGAAAATPATSAVRASASYSAADGGVAPSGPPFGYRICPREHSSNVGGHARTGGGVAAAGASGLRFDPDFDLEPLDMIPRHDDLGARSDWDDVLAAVSLPHQAAAPRDSLAQGESPDRTRD